MMHTGLPHGLLGRQAAWHCMPGTLHSDVYSHAYPVLPGPVQCGSRTRGGKSSGSRC